MKYFCRMNLQQASQRIALPESQEKQVLNTPRKRKIEVDLLTDDHIRQMLVKIGSNFQADPGNRKKITMLTTQQNPN